MKSEMSVFESLKYVIAMPDSFDPSRRYSCIIFLHGSGTRGDDTARLLGNCYFEHFARHRLEAITAAPLCSADSWCDVHEQLMRFAEFISESRFVDSERVYLMGTSMGGYETWQLAISRPELFAAAVPICGGGAYWNASRLNSIPIVAYHGSDDDCVFPEESQKMVNAVNAAGGSARLELIGGVGHAVWEYAYSSKKLFEWLLRQKKSSVSEVSSREMSDPVRFG